MSNRRLITVALPVLFVSACAFAQLDLPWDDDDDLWDNDHDSRSVEEILASGPEIRDPFFEICLGLVQGDSLGVWTGDELAARTKVFFSSIKKTLVCIGSMAELSNR